MAAPTPRPSRNRRPSEEVGVSSQCELSPGAPGWVALARSPFLQATLGLWAARPPLPDSFYFSGGPVQCTQKSGKTQPSELVPSVCASEASAG